jgi:hypothetical protein
VLAGAPCHLHKFYRAEVQEFRIRQFVVSMVVPNRVGINMWVLGIIGINTIEPIIVRVLVAVSSSAVRSTANAGINTTACGSAGSLARPGGRCAREMAQMAQAMTVMNTDNSLLGLLPVGLPPLTLAV